MLTFEVRVPTYNRPDLLARALRSLQAQTYPHWIATVYDDASAGEETVRAIADDRIRYRRNPQKLGACENIDKCFNPASVSGGTHGYVLEDDNFLLPGFLSLIASHLEKTPWQLIQANQRVWSNAHGMHQEDETTRGLWFQSGRMEVIHLRSFGRGLQSIRRYILEHAGSKVLEALPQKQNLRDELVSILAHSGYSHLVPVNITAPLLRARLKGLALRLTQPDPCAEFLAKLDERSSLCRL